MNNNGKINYAALSVCIGLVGTLAVANIAAGPAVHMVHVECYCGVCQQHSEVGQPDNVPYTDNGSSEYTELVGEQMDLDIDTAYAVVDTQVQHYPEVSRPDGWYPSDDDVYYLAKIVKCEAGICDMETKVRHAMVVLNRVWSDSFPDTVYDVVTQNSGGVYQFSPVIPGGSWYKEEPDNECYEAVQIALNAKYDISNGATFFEATGSDSVWHQKNLVQVCESDGVRFYKVP